jgi:hypothetical protein
MVHRRRHCAPEAETMTTSQNFALGIDGASATTFALNTLTPRVPRMLRRLVIVAPQQLGSTRPLLQALSVSGSNLYLPAANLSVVNGTVVRTGFPGEALGAAAQVDLSNVLNVAAGPTTPVELAYSLNQAEPLTGYIGTDDVPQELMPDVLASLRAGELYGELNFALGLGEIQQSSANTAQTLQVTCKAPRSMNLKRAVVVCYRDNGGVVQSNEVKLDRFDLAGDPLLATGQSIDALALGPDCTDEDGLSVNERVESDTTIRLDFSVVAAGAGVSFILHVGFFTD